LKAFKKASKAQKIGFEAGLKKLTDGRKMAAKFAQKSAKSQKDFHMEVKISKN